MHAHLFQKDFFTRRTAANVSYLVRSTFELLEIKNARNLMQTLYDKGEISAQEYSAWKKKTHKIE